MFERFELTHKPQILKYRISWKTKWRKVYQLKLIYLLIVRYSWKKKPCLRWVPGAHEFPHIHRDPKNRIEHKQYTAILKIGSLLETQLAQGGQQVL